VPSVTPELTPEVKKLLNIMQGEMSRGDLMTAPGLKDEKHFRERYQQAGVAPGVIEMTIPDKPRISKQNDKNRPLYRRHRSASLLLRPIPGIR